MKVAIFLHAYQPPTQFAEITKRIVQESYSPLVQTLLDHPMSRLSLNISGSLTEQLIQLGEHDLISKIRYLSLQGQIELVSTAAYHPLLTSLSEAEIVRQTEVNALINLEAFGEGFEYPRGYFLPEMVYERRVAEVVSSMGYEWIVLDESAFPSAGATGESIRKHFELKISENIYKIPNLPLYVFFRNRPISLEIAFSKSIDIDEFVRKLEQHYLKGQENYVVIAVDAETFGHHNKTNLKLLNELMTHPNIEMVKVTELLSFGFPEVEVEPTRSTWGVTLEDDNQKRTFPRWDNPQNPIHQLQWELMNLALATVKHQSNGPDLLDRAVHSDQFWWASYNPCWHPILVEKGARMMVTAIEEDSNTSAEQRARANKLYKDIVSVGREMYGDKVVNC